MDDVNIPSCLGYFLISFSSSNSHLCISYFSGCCEKTLDKHNLSKEGFISTLIHSYLDGILHHYTDVLVSEETAVRKQGKNTDAPFILTTI